MKPSELLDKKYNDIRNEIARRKSEGYYSMFFEYPGDTVIAALRDDGVHVSVGLERCTARWGFR